MTVGGEMGGNPVENNPNPLAMTFVNQISKIFRGAKAAGYRVKAGHLIAPGFIQRMFGQRQQLNMGKTHLPHVGNQGGGDFSVREETGRIARITAPGTQVDLVNGQRLAIAGLLAAAGHPLLVTPRKIGDIPDHRGAFGANFAEKLIRVGFF